MLELAVGIFDICDHFWISLKRKVFFNCLATRLRNDHFCQKLDFLAEKKYVGSFLVKNNFYNIADAIFLLKTT